MINFKTYGSLVLACICMLVSNLSAQDLRQDEKLVRGKLKNGFQYFIYPNKSNNNQQTAIQLFVNAGSLQERDDQLGLAHFVEHMAFNGSKNYPKNEVITYLESLGVKFGADLNAHTSYDETVYKITIDTKNEQNLYKALDIVYDWAYNLSFDSLELEKERGIIIEEWRTKQGAAARISDQTLPLIFYNSRYASRKPIGTLEVLRHFQRPTIIDFYKNWYRPDLMAIAVVTNQDTKKVEKVIKKLFSRNKAAKNPLKRESYKLAEHKDTLVNIYTDKEATSIDFSYITKLPAVGPLKTEADLSNRLTRSIVNSLLKSRFERISQLNHVYKSASISFSDLLVNNGLSIGGAVLFEDQIVEGISEFLKVKQSIIKYGFTTQEIEVYKKQLKAQLLRAKDQESTINAQLLLGQLKDSFMAGDVLMDRINRRDISVQLVDAVDSVALLSHLRSYFTPGNTVVLLSGPDRVKANLPSEAQLRALFHKATLEEVKPWKDKLDVPTQLLDKEPIAGKVITKSTISEVGVDKWTLSNGATVYLKKSESRKGHIQMTGFRKGGYLALDTSKFVNGVYVKNILGASGAGNIDRQSLTRYLNGNSASATFMISSHREGLSASANLKDMKTMFELLYLKWTAPRLDDNVFNSIKKNALDAARNRKFNVMDEYSKQVNRAIGADDSDENNISVSRLQNSLTKEGLIPVFKERFGSANGFDFIFVGDYNADSLQVFIEKYIASLPGDVVKDTQRKPSYNKVKSKDILLYAGEADKATVNIFFQTTNYKYDYPEILKNEIAESILRVKLRKNLREEHSGVYGVGVNVSATSEPTTLIRTSVSFTCEPARKDFLMEQVFVELNKVVDNPDYFAEELENAKIAMIQAYNKQKDKDTFWSAELRNHVYFGFSNFDYFNNYEKMVNGITTSDMAKFIKHNIVKANVVKAVMMPENSKK